MTWHAQITQHPSGYQDSVTYVVASLFAWSHGAKKSTEPKSPLKFFSRPPNLECQKSSFPEMLYRKNSYQYVGNRSLFPKQRKPPLSKPNSDHWFWQATATTTTIQLNEIEDKTNSRVLLEWGYWIPGTILLLRRSPLANIIIQDVTIQNVI